MQNMELAPALKNLGLSDKESAVYIALLQLGKTSVYAIARKSGIKRPTVYVVVHELIEKGLAERVPRSRKQLYAAKSPDEIFAVAEERLNTAKDILPELRALARSGAGSKVRTTYHEGLKQTQDAYFDTLRHGKTDIVGWVSNVPFETQGREFWYKEYQKKRLAQQTKARLIVPNMPWMKEYAKDDEKTLKETRTETDKNYQPTTEILMYGDERVVVTSFAEEMGLIIESKALHQSLKAIFERHWSDLEE